MHNDIRPQQDQPAPKGPPDCGGEDLLETWLTLYLSLHVGFTTLIHAVSNTGRGLDARDGLIF